MANTCRHPIDKVKVLTLADPMVQWCTLCGATRFITGTFGQAAKSPKWRSPKLALKSSLPEEKAPARVDFGTAIQISSVGSTRAQPVSLNGRWSCSKCDAACYYDGRCGDGPILTCKCNESEHNRYLSETR